VSISATLDSGSFICELLGEDGGELRKLEEVGDTEMEDWATGVGKGSDENFAMPSDCSD